MADTAYVFADETGRIVRRVYQWSHLDPSRLEGGVEVARGDLDAPEPSEEGLRPVAYLEDGQVVWHEEPAPPPEGGDPEARAEVIGKIVELYGDGVFTDDDVDRAVEAGVITEAEAETIRGGGEG